MVTSLKHFRPLSATVQTICYSLLTFASAILHGHHPDPNPILPVVIYGGFVMAYLASSKLAKLKYWGGGGGDMCLSVLPVPYTHDNVFGLTLFPGLGLSNTALYGVYLTTVAIIIKVFSYLKESGASSNDV